MAMAVPIGEGAPPLLYIPANADQRRWTVLLRLIILIPAAIWTGLVGIAAFFVLIAGWLAALFTGRLPDSIGGFLEAFLNLEIRVHSNLLLLTDTYPSFALHSELQPGEFRIATQRSPLNRAAVFFRIILAIPAGIVTEIIGIGFFVIAVVSWFIILVTGRSPDPVRDAGTAVLRYTMRYYAYWGLLTSAYPSGLFGDLPLYDDAASPAAAGGWAPPAGTPIASGVAGEVAEQEEPAVAEPGLPRYPGGSAASEPIVPAATPSGHRTTLVLGQNAKTLVVVAIVLGILGYFANIAFTRHNNAPNSTPGVLAPLLPGQQISVDYSHLASDHQLFVSEL